MKRQYELHFVRHEKKYTLRVIFDGMTEISSWKIVAINCGACFGEFGSTNSYQELVEAAGRMGIENVRWNRASHTMAFSERAELKSQQIKIVDITNA